MKDPLWLSFKTNWIFYLTLIICLLLINRSGFFGSLFSFIFFAILGYFIHYLSHNINFTQLYTSNNNYFTKNRILNNIFIWICSILDFHNDIHHDTKINKTRKNIIYEFLNNFITQGLGVYIIILIGRYLDLKMAIFWGLFYATFHNINYWIKPCESHINHHANKHTNYGLDTIDILMGSKDNSEIENYNSGSINLIFISLVFILFRYMQSISFI
jgi:hypothetical protein